MLKLNKIQQISKQIALKLKLDLDIRLKIFPSNSTFRILQRHPHRIIVMVDVNLLSKKLTNERNHRLFLKIIAADQRKPKSMNSGDKISCSN